MHNAAIFYRSNTFQRWHWDHWHRWTVVTRVSIISSHCAEGYYRQVDSGHRCAGWHHSTPFCSTRRLCRYSTSAVARRGRRHECWWGEKDCSFQYLTKCCQSFITAVSVYLQQQSLFSMLEKCDQFHWHRIADQWQDLKLGPLNWLLVHTMCGLIVWLDVQYDVTPLHCASCEGHTAIVTMLLERGADPNKANVVRWVAPSNTL